MVPPARFRSLTAATGGRSPTEGRREKTRDRRPADPAVRTSLHARPGVAGPRTHATLVPPLGRELGETLRVRRTRVRELAVPRRGHGPVLSMILELFVGSPGEAEPIFLTAPPLDMPFTAVSRPTGRSMSGCQAFISEVEETGAMREHAGSDSFENAVPGRRPSCAVSSRAADANSREWRTRVAPLQCFKGEDSCGICCSRWWSPERS